MRLFLGNCRVSLQCVPRRRFESDCDDSAGTRASRARATVVAARGAGAPVCRPLTPTSLVARRAPARRPCRLRAGGGAGCSMCCVRHRPRAGLPGQLPHMGTALGAACVACVIGPVQGCPGSFRTWAPRVRSPMWPVAQCARAPASVPIPLDTGMRRCIAQDVAVAGPRVPPPQQRPGTESG